MFCERDEQGIGEPLIFCTCNDWIALYEPVMNQRTTAIGVLAEDHLIRQAAGLHAAQRDETIGPRIGSFTDKISDRSRACSVQFPFGRTVNAQLDICIDLPPSLTISRGQLQLIHGHGRMVAAHADGGDPLFKVTGMPDVHFVVPAFEQVT